MSPTTQVLLELGLTRTDVLWYLATLGLLSGEGLTEWGNDHEAERARELEEGFARAVARETGIHGGDVADFGFYAQTDVGPAFAKAGAGEQDGPVLGISRTGGSGARVTAHSQHR